MMMPVKAALLCRGTELARMVRAPFIRPDEPAPATTLPMISIVDETATPHIRDPASNTAKKTKKVNWSIVVSAAQW